MKISVITVCYNSAKTLERALLSVAEQNWPDIEHIIIDGGSTDETAEILSAHRSKLACIISEPDHGIYDAMNKGISHTQGDIVCFLNADDKYAAPDVLSLVGRTMSDERLDALMGDVAFYRPDNPLKAIRRYRSQHFTPSRLAWGWMPAHPALFLSRDVIRRVGGFNPNYLLAGDFEFVIRVFHGQNLKYKHVYRILVDMQTGGVSTSGWRSKILLNKEVLRACRENGIQTNLLKILSKYPIKLLEMKLPLR